MILMLFTSLQYIHGFTHIRPKFHSSFRGRAYFASLETPKTEEVQKFDQKAWEKGFCDCTEEICENISEGIPKDLEGTYFKNNFGKFQIGKDQLQHPFDADGMITAFTFNNGTAFFRNRFVRTKGFLRDRKFRRLTQRTFGTEPSGGLIQRIFQTKTKNTANTNVVYWAGRLLALYESGGPHLIEADSLRTVGLSTIKGVLKQNQAFSAHPRIDSNSNRLINFSTFHITKGSKVEIYEFDQKFGLYQKRMVDFPGFAFMHDFAVTKNYYIFTQCPVDFDMMSFVLGSKPGGMCVSYDKKRPAVIHLVPRDLNKPVKTVTVSSHFNFHFANAHENEQGQILLDTIEANDLVLGEVKNGPIWKGFDWVKEGPKNQLKRYVLTQNNEGEWTEKNSYLSSAFLDFPVLNPKVAGKKNRFIFAACGASVTEPNPLQVLLKIDLDQKKEEKWLPKPEEFIGEPMFASKKGSGSEAAEDEGYILTISFNGKTEISELLIFDAQKITQGPISRVAIPVKIPFGLHGSYVPDLVFNEKDVIRKFKTFSALDSKNWNEVDGGFSGLGLKYEL